MTGGRAAGGTGAAGDPELLARTLWAALWRDGTRRRWRRRTVLDGPGRSRTAVWPVSQVLAAALDVHLLTGDDGPARDVLDALDRYRTPGGFAPYPGDPACYYDDNAWLGLGLVQAAEQLDRPALLDEAVRVVETLAAAEHPDGGIPWRRGRAEPRNTCSTAPTAQLALVVHRHLGDGALVALAERCVAFLDDTLRGADDTYADHVEPDGRIEPTRWSYNQGTPIGAKVLLAEVAGAAEALDDAELLAHAALGRLDHDELWRQPAVFDAVLFRNLLALDCVRPLPVVRDRLDAYLRRVATTALDPASGWALGGDIGRYEGGGTIDQAGLVQIAALAALPPARRARVI